MNSEQIQILKDKLNINLNQKQIDNFDKWEKLFIEYNSHTNLMSKNEVKNLFEKHIFDSLALSLIKNFNMVNSITDVGTGGGFPSVIIAIAYPDIKINAIDSTGKKIKFIEIVKKELEIDNLTPLLGRSENLYVKPADIAVSRAVGKINDVFENSKKLIKPKGRFVIYKAANVEDEISEALKTNNNLQKPEITEYNLPTDVPYVRKLLSFDVKGQF